MCLIKFVCCWSWKICSVWFPWIVIHLLVFIFFGIFSYFKHCEILLCRFNFCCWKFDVSLLLDILEFTVCELNKCNLSWAFYFSLFNCHVDNKNSFYKIIRNIYLLICKNVNILTFRVLCKKDVWCIVRSIKRTDWNIYCSVMKPVLL